jgi:hypothetical protein
MHFCQRIPEKYLRFIPAIYFALFGIVVVVSSLIHHFFDWTNFIIVCITLPPLFTRNKVIIYLCSIPLIVLSGFFSMVYCLAFLVGEDDGASARTWEMLGLILFALCSFLCALSLLHVASRPGDGLKKVS